MTEKELTLQIELLQKQNAKLKDTNSKLQSQLKELTEQVEDFKLQRDITQAINMINNKGD